jgi:hypothetical protein
VKNQSLVATQGEMFYDLPLHLPLGFLYLGASLLRPIRLLYAVVHPDHSGQQECSRLDPTMSYLWGTLQVPKSMLSRFGIKI